MAVDGVGKIRTVEGIGSLKIDTGHQSMERDAQSGQNPYQKHAINSLAPDQESKILEFLNSNPAFVKAGWTASVVREHNKPAFFALKDQSGKIMHQMSYSECVENYLQSKSDGDKGLVLRRSA